MDRKGLEQAVLNLLFPPRCVLCRRLLNREQTWLGLCSLCRWEDYRNLQPLTAEGRCSLVYEDRLQQAIYRLKYAGLSSYGAYMARWMMEEGGAWAKKQNFDLMTAVPLSDSRMRRRGYNQAERIARELSRLCRVPYEEILVRRRETKPQSGLGETMRWRNVKNGFEVRCAKTLAPQHICIVDDIWTTGSTIRACGEALRESWPQVRVSGWVLAGRMYEERRPENPVRA